MQFRHMSLFTFIYMTLTFECSLTKTQVGGVDGSVK